MNAQNEKDSLRIVEDALKMIHFSNPEFTSPYIPNITPKSMEDMGFEQPNQSEAMKFIMRDGNKLHAQRYEYKSDKTIILLHGTLANSFTYNKMAGLLRDAVKANVIAVDLRGHGQSEGIVGDVTTLNQYAEDLDDIISTIRKEKPEETIILAGHSMGGGIVLRHAETFPNTKINAYLLFAPNLGNNTPTTSQDLNLKSNFIKTHLSRGLGLRYLNEFGIHEYDSLPVVFYNLPEQMPLRSYSYRSMQASFPKDYRTAFRSINEPLLVLVGNEDEVFIAEEYPIIVNSYSSGDISIIDGETHNGIRHNNEAMKILKAWSIKNNLRN